MSGAVIRDFHWTDIPAACQIEAYAFPSDTWSPESFWGELARPESQGRYFAAVAGPIPSDRSLFGVDWRYTANPPRTVIGDVGEGGKLIGYAGVAFTGDDAHLQTIAVSDAARGRGVGRGLLAAVVDEAIARGAHRCFLEVNAENSAAMAMYSAAGFEQFGTRPGYYPGGEEALVLAKDLRSTNAGGDDDVR